MLADSPPALENSSRQWLEAQPHLPAAPSFPFRSFLSHAFICLWVLKSSPVGELEPFTKRLSLHTHSFFLWPVSSTALLLSLLGFCVLNTAHPSGLAGTDSMCVSSSHKTLGQWRGDTKPGIALAFVRPVEVSALPLGALE